MDAWRCAWSADYSAIISTSPVSPINPRLSTNLTIMSAIYAKLADELGLKILFSAPRDAHLLILQRVFRLVAYGQSTLVLTGLLHSLGFADFQMGLFMTLTLFGDVGGSLILTIFADRWGRRKVLLIGSLLMASSGVVFATSGSYTVLLLAAMAGVISPRCVVHLPLNDTRLTITQRERDWTVQSHRGVHPCHPHPIGSAIYHLRLVRCLLWPCRVTRISLQRMDNFLSPANAWMERHPSVSLRLRDLYDLGFGQKRVDDLFERKM